MKKFLLGDFYEGDRVILADGRDGVVVRLEDGDSLRVKTSEGREEIVKIGEVIGRDSLQPPV